MVGKSLMCKGDKRTFQQWHACFNKADELIKDSRFNVIVIAFPKDSALLNPLPLSTVAEELCSIPRNLFGSKAGMLEKVFFPAFIAHLRKREDYVELAPKTNPVNSDQNIVRFVRSPSP